MPEAGVTRRPRDRGASCDVRARPRSLREGWLKCRDANEDGYVASPYEDVWCVLESEGVLSCYREPAATGSRERAEVSLVLSRVHLEENPGSILSPSALCSFQIPRGRDLAQLGFALRCKEANIYLHLRASSVRERAIWLAALSPHVGNPRRTPLFAFMDDPSREENGFRSLPRKSLGTRSISVAASPSLRDSCHAPKGVGRLALASVAGKGGDAHRQREALHTLQRPQTFKRRGSLRELVKRAAGDANALVWSHQPEVVASRVTEKLNEQQLVLESLRFTLVTSEVLYNNELSDLVTLAKRSISWHDPLPVYNRRTIASIVEKVKKCSDSILADMEQTWQKKLTFDGIFVIYQEHIEEFDNFITYCNHLLELSNVIKSAKMKKSEISNQAFSKYYNIERVFLPLLRLTIIRKMLLIMRDLLLTTHSHLEHFHCKRTLSQISEILEECYKILAAASSSSFVTSLEKTLEDCCSSSIPVTCSEVFKTEESTGNNSVISANSVCKEEESSKRKVGSRTSTYVSLGKGINTWRSKQTLKTSMQQKKKVSNIKSSVESVSSSTIGNQINSTTKEDRIGQTIRNEIEIGSNKVQVSKRIKPNTSQSIHKNSVKVEVPSNIETKLNSPLDSSGKVYKSSSTSRIHEPKYFSTSPRHISIVEIPLHDTSDITNSTIDATNTEMLDSPSNVQESTKTKESNPINSELQKFSFNEISDQTNHSNEELTHECDANKSKEEQLYFQKCDLSGDHKTKLSSDDISSTTNFKEIVSSVLLPHDNSDRIETMHTSETKNVENLISKDNNYDLSEIEDNVFYDYPVHQIGNITPDLQSSNIHFKDAHIKENDKEQSTENIYDYVYVTDDAASVKSMFSYSENSSNTNADRSLEVIYETAPTENKKITETKDHQHSDAQNENDFEDNVYEDIQYVDMKPKFDDHKSSIQNSCQYDNEVLNDIYESIGIYMQPDTPPRNKQDGHQHSSSSGNEDEILLSHIYYNSPNTSVSNVPNSSSDNTNNLSKTKLKRSPSTASISLQNMVRWKNMQPQSNTSSLVNEKDNLLTPLESPFNDAPLYQEYYETRSIQKVYKTKLFGSEDDYEHNSDIDDKSIESKEPVYETLDEYLVRHNMVSITDTFKRRVGIEKSDNRRTQWCETEEVLESGLLGEMTVDQRRLQEAKFEIITSEVSFLKSLNILEKYFINNPELNSKDVLSKEDRITLFLPIVPVKETSQCLLQDLVKVWEDNIILNNLQLGEVLHKYARGRFRAYIAYCSRQVDINVSLNTLRERNKKFTEIIEKIEMKPVCQAFMLQSFLTQPMQRITRFPMLVKAILRHLPPQDETTPLWQNVLSTLQGVVKECNEAVRNAEITLAHKKEESKKKAFWSKFQNKR